MQEKAFWAFFGFGVLTVLFAFAGGFFSLFRHGGFGSGAFGFLLLFLGASLALMLGSLVFIRQKERKKGMEHGG